MENLFQAEALHQDIDERGVITLPLLHPEEVQEIKDFYQELHPDGIPPQMWDGIHMTIWCSDFDYKIKVREKLLSILQPALERTFQDFRIVSPVFIVKRNGAETTFPIHQDWNVVDEEKHRAFNVWIPLHAVDANNGSLWHVPGSHKLPNMVRGPGLLFPNLHDLPDHIAPVMKSLSLTPGEAMIFYHRLIHGSPPNHGDAYRVVVSCSVLPKKVPFHIYFQQDLESPLQVFHPEDDFIYHFENVREDTGRLAPEGTLVEERPPYQPVAITREIFESHLPGMLPPLEPVPVPVAAIPSSLGFWDRVKRLWGK